MKTELQLEPHSSETASSQQLADTILSIWGTYVT